MVLASAQLWWALMTDGYHNDGSTCRKVQKARQEVREIHDLICNSLLSWDFPQEQEYSL
jgi:hypothetical protein